MKREVDAKKNLILLCIFIFISTTQQREFIWSGTCDVWSPSMNSSCWNPYGIPSPHDAILIPSNTKMTISCPANYSGSDNYFYNISQPYGPTCAIAFQSFQVSSDAHLRITSYLSLIISDKSVLHQSLYFLLHISL